MEYLTAVLLLTEAAIVIVSKDKHTFLVDLFKLNLFFILTYFKLLDCMFQRFYKTLNIFNECLVKVKYGMHVQI